MAAPQKLDVYLESLGEFQEGATALKAGEPLSLQQQEDGRLVCATQGGAVVGLVPADKRGLLSRGPWAGTVRSVKRKVAGPAAVEGGGEPATAAAADTATAAADTATAAGAASGAAVAALAAPAAAPVPEPSALAEIQGSLGEQHQQGEGIQPAAAEAQQGAAAAAAAAPAAAASVVQLLVRFVPEEQRWQQARQQQQQQHAEGLPSQQFEDESMARLTTEQFEQLAGSEEVRWMLRDERLQQVVAEVDAAPDRERALLKALQAPNFKEFTDKVLAVVAPDS